MKIDNRNNYESYVPNNDEMTLIAAVLKSLPPLHKNILQKRLIGIYFIKNFLGNGLTQWVASPNGNIYTFMVFNPNSLKKNISLLLTEKEKTCFIQNDSAIDIKINCGTYYNGFYYIMLHETTHVVDYVINITPYTDEDYKKALSIKILNNDFTKDIWKNYNTPVTSYYFTKKLFFYGSAPPQLLITDAEKVYQDLVLSPFASLYGSLTWAEDYAELLVFYHFTRILKQPYIITVTKAGKQLVSINPMDTTPVRKRLPLLKKMYENE